MKVISVSGSLLEYLGGPPLVTVKLSELLEQYFDHELIVFGQQEKFFQSNFILRTLFNNRFGFFLFPNKQVVSIIKSADIMVCHGYYMYSTLFARIISPVKLLVIPHGSLDD